MKQTFKVLNKGHILELKKKNSLVYNLLEYKNKFNFLNSKELIPMNNYELPEPINKNYKKFNESKIIIGVFYPDSIYTYPLCLINILKKMKLKKTLRMFKIKSKRYDNYNFSHDFIKIIEMDENEISDHLKNIDIFYHSVNDFSINIDYFPILHKCIELNIPFILPKGSLQEEIFGKNYYGFFNLSTTNKYFKNDKNNIIPNIDALNCIKSEILLEKLITNIHNIMINTKSHLVFNNEQRKQIINKNIKKIFIICIKINLKICTIREYVESFEIYSSHKIIYVDENGLDLLNTVTDNDAIIFSYDTIHKFVNNNKYIPIAKNINCLKIAIIQDEYYDCDNIRQFIIINNIKIIFTCMKEFDILKIYGDLISEDILFINTLTGYVSSTTNFIEIKNKNIDIFYRGRNLDFFYGELGVLKKKIGMEFKKICNKYGLKHDIEWDDKHRIYGKEWFRILGDAKITLATPSGSNVINRNWILKKKIKNELKNSPTKKYEYIKSKFNIREELNCGQLSPKMLEAISFGTVLIIQDFNSDILKRDLHYIHLEKDYSNIDNVIKVIKSEKKLKEIANRAFNDIIVSGKYSYKKFINFIDLLLQN